MSDFLRHPFGLSRRGLIKAGVGLAATPLIVPPSFAADRITVADPGGVYSVAWGESFYAPFRKTGVDVIGVARDAEPTSQVKAQVEAHSYIWDVVSVTLSSRKLLSDAGLLEPLDLSGPDWDELLPLARKRDWMGTNVFGSIIGYRADTMKSRPASWADFYDIKGHPGRRSLPKSPIQTLEGALIADGVAPKDLYPLDVDRAFKKLDTIKPHIAVWWTSFTQTTQLLQSGEVDILASSNARVQAAIDSGAPVEIIWDGGFYGMEGWAIPKGNPRAALAKRFITFCANAKRQAVYTKMLAYGPTNPQAYKYIDPARARQLPSEKSNFAKMVPVNDDWWGANKDRMFERFDAWLLA